MRVDLDLLLSLPPPPPPPMAAAVPMELDFDDVPLPDTTPRAEPKATKSEAPSIQPIAIEEPPPRRRERQQRPGALRAVVALAGVVTLGTALAIDLRAPATPPRSIGSQLAPATALFSRLGATAASWTPQATPAEPVDADPTVASKGTIVQRRLSGPRRIAAHASAPPAAGASPTSEPSATPAAEETPVAGPFDAAGARAALAGHLSAATACFTPGAPGGVARVAVTFNGDGRSTRAVVSGAPYGGTPIGSCIASAFRGATVPAFEGPPVTVVTTVPHTAEATPPAP